MLEAFHQLGADDARLLRRFQDDGVPRDDGRGGHAAEDGEREVPRGDDNRDTAGFVEVVVLLPRHRHALPGPHFQCFGGVVVAEIDRLGDVGVGLAPGLAGLEDDPRGEFEPASAHHRRNLPQVRGSIVDGDILPRLEGRLARGHGLLGLLDGGLPGTADEFDFLRRIERFDELGRSHRGVADDDGERPPELAAHGAQGLHDGVAVRFPGEVAQWFVVEFDLREDAVGMRSGHGVLVCRMAKRD